MIRILRQYAYKHGYLIITAAWLYTISFLFTNYFATDASTGKVADILSNYLTEKENRFNAVTKDTAFLRDIAGNDISEKRKDIDEKSFGLFIYAINDLGNPIEVYWNSNLMSVPDIDLKRKDGFYAVKYKNGYFELLKKTVVFDGNQHIIAGLIPVYWDYSVETKDVQKEFAVKGVEKKYNISLGGIGDAVINSLQTPVFYISNRDNLSPDQPGIFSVILRILAIILLMMYINALATTLVERTNFLKGFLFLLATVVILRILTYFLPFPFDLKNFALFAPDVYASSNLHPSLGDLLINTILLYWIVSFIKFNYKSIKPPQLSETIKKTISVIALFLLPLFTMEIANFLSSLVLDSSRISFDVTNFFDLNIYTLVSFIIICFLLISYFYVAQLLVNISHLFQAGMYWRVILILTFSLFLLSFKISGDNDTLLNFILILWIIIFYFFIELGKDDIEHSFYGSAYFMPWSIFLIASVSALLIFQNKALEHRKRSNIAETFSLKSDYTSAKILDVALAGFSSFIAQNNFNKFYSETDNKHLKESLANNNFQGYLNNFVTHIFTYDSHQDPLFNDDSTSFNVIKSIVINQSKETDIPDLYYYESPVSGFSYIYEKDVYNADSILQGNIFLFIRPKVYGEQEFSPQLFSQLVRDEPLTGNDYAYAIYNRYNLFKTSGNYNFSDTISKKDVPKFGEQYVERGEYTELWYNAGDNKVVVVARKNIWLKEAITFFAYLFGLLILLVAVQHFGSLIFKTNFKWRPLQKVFRFNIRTQIQAIIVSVSIISFIVIGIAIISFFIFSFNNNNEKRLRSTAQVIVNEIQELSGNSFVASDMISLDKLDLRTELEQKILEIGNIHNTDINFFDVNGNLLVSSQKYVYDNAILSRKMQPAAFYSMHYDRSTQFIQQEEIVDFNFKSIYVPVKGSDKSTYAYLNIPFINTQNELKQEISNFLVTILDLNALIFIIAGTIAIWITRRITTSFTLIGNKMKAISFGSVNEEIEWKKDDELGELIAEYNKMVRKLAESAQALARSEREGAWREMARQVAHEIKNPLTPMKLSIQYLQRAIDNNLPNVKDLSRQVAGTLVEQIDQLSKIAGDFSQFANIANVTIEVIDLSNIIEMIVQLYSTDQNIHITWQKERGNYFIEADRTQINRLFTNLIKNGIEAHENLENIRINIQQSKRGKEVLISVQDNGYGIPPAMRPKIFTPNFTTKSSGTGLGLAICKGIVEKANGHIWFETQEKVGTTFFVSLPLVNKK